MVLTRVKKFWYTVYWPYARRVIGYFFLYVIVFFFLSILFLVIFLKINPDIFTLYERVFCFRTILFIFYLFIKYKFFSVLFFLILILSNLVFLCLYLRYFFVSSRDGKTCYYTLPDLMFILKVSFIPLNSLFFLFVFYLHFFDLFFMFEGMLF